MKRFNTRFFFSSTLGLVELLWQKRNFKALLSAVQLCKCFRAKLWEDSKFISKQLEGIGKSLIGSYILLIRKKFVIPCVSFVLEVDV